MAYLNPAILRKDLIEILYSHRDGLQLYSFLDGRGKLNDGLTVAQLKNDIERFATKLGKVEAGERVILLFPTCKEFIIAFFSCLYCGVIPVPVAIPGRRNGIQHMLSIQRDCAASAVIADEKTYKLLQDDLSSTQFAQLPVYFVNEFHDLPPTLQRRYNQNQIAFLQYTSGSTSSPKGVVVTHENIVANQYMIHERFQTTAETIFLGWTPLHHDMGLIGNVMQPMYIGCKCYLIPPTTLLMRPKVWLKILSDYQITVTGGPNFSYKTIVNRVDESVAKALKLDLSKLVVLYNGAEPIELRVMDAFTDRFKPYGFAREAFLPCYGMAEATLIVSGIYPKDAYQAKSLCDGGKQYEEHALINAITRESNSYVACGSAVAGLEIRIRSDQTGESLPVGEVGTIEIRGQSISPAYWSDKAIASEYLEQAWLNTGDLGFLDDDGQLYICGRTKDLIIVDGKNHYPQDIESVVRNLKSQVELTEAAVFEESGAIYFFAELGKKSLRHITLQNLLDLKSSIKETVTREHGLTLSKVVLLKPNSIPKTTSFKVQRQKLRRLYRDQKIKELQPNE